MSLHSYELIDCGGGRRLERFGDVVVDRPARHAAWNRRLPPSVWNSADARFVKEGERSFWKFSKELPTSWVISFDKIQMEMRFSENGQLGIFPEQMDNWFWLRDFIKKSDRELKILNAFGYTGGSTLFSSFGGKEGSGANVTHLDGSKSSVSWARKNVEHSELSTEKVRYIVDDVITFMEKEVKRGRHYDGFIFDPPAFGRAPGKKTWILKRDLSKLIDLCNKLMSDDPYFVLISCHDPEITIKTLGRNAHKISAITPGEEERKELVIHSTKGNELPNGIAVRWSKPI